MRKKVILYCFVSAIALISLEGCAKRPFACFSTSPEESNLHVNQPVTFNTACTSNGSEFYWEFYNIQDSTEFGPTVIKTFADTGNVHVYLQVLNGHKSSVITRDIHINP